MQVQLWAHSRRGEAVWLDVYHRLQRNSPWEGGQKDHSNDGFFSIEPMDNWLNLLSSIYISDMTWVGNLEYAPIYCISFARIKFLLILNINLKKEHLKYLQFCSYFCALFFILHFSTHCYAVAYFAVIPILNESK